MAIEKIYLDPNAQAYTDDEIVGKVNTATANISRASSVTAAARPIGAGEVGNDEIEAAAGIAKSKLAALEIANADVATGAAISVDKTADGTTNKVFSGTEQTKLGTVEDSATADQTEADIKTLFTWTTSPEDGATGDQTGTEVKDLVVALADDDREIVISRPTVGQKKIYAVQTHTDGKQEVEQSDTAES